PYYTSDGKMWRRQFDTGLLNPRIDPPFYSPASTPSASDGTFTDHIDISWTLIPYALGYKLIRVGGGETREIGWLGPYVTNWQDNANSGVKPGVNYTYTVVAGWSPSNGDFLGQVRLSADTGYINAASATKGTFPTIINVSWPAIPGAEGYKLV